MAFVYSGVLKSHQDWVCALACPAYTPAPPIDMSCSKTRPSNCSRHVLISSSRDRSVVIWRYSPLCERGAILNSKRSRHRRARESNSGLSETSSTSSTSAATVAPVVNPVKRLQGHNHFVVDISLGESPTGHYIASASWDRTVRIWDRETGDLMYKSVSVHSKEILSVAFGPQCETTLSAGADGRLCLMTLKGDLIAHIDAAHGLSENGLPCWVNRVRVPPRGNCVITVGTDARVRIWAYPTLRPVAASPVPLRQDEISSGDERKGHSAEILCLHISPDGSLCATGDREGEVHLWELIDAAKVPLGTVQVLKSLVSINTGHQVNDVCFCPTRFWLAVATESSVLVYDIAAPKEPIAELIPEVFHDIPPEGRTGRRKCKSLAWSNEALYTGYSDNAIRRWISALDAP